MVVSVVSVVLVVLTLAVSHLSSQEAARLAVDLPTPRRSKVNLKIIKHIYTADRDLNSR